VLGVYIVEEADNKALMLEGLLCLSEAAKPKRSLAFHLVSPRGKEWVLLLAVLAIRLDRYARDEDGLRE
jgi:hypothetical protein